MDMLIWKGESFSGNIGGVWVINGEGDKCDYIIILKC